MNNQPLITISVPVYNNPELLNECLKSIQNQTFKDFTVLIVDDNSQADYKNIRNAFSDLKIDYIKHSENLGAVQNMMYCIGKKYDTKYFMVFHEDDVLQPQFLEISIQILEKNPDIVFSCCNMNFFKKYNEISFNCDINDINLCFCNQKDFTEKILQGNTISWSSVIYRSDTIKPVFNIEKYSMLGDRPFLIELLSDKKCAFIKNEMFTAFNHTENDTRWKTLKHKHIINLYKFYFEFFRSETKYKIYSIKKSATIQIFANYKLLPKQHFFIFLKFVIKSLVYKQISLKYMILQNDKLRHFIEKLKK
jgi:glycosyltransferase involved in cell wall biosynthesis